MPITFDTSAKGGMTSSDRCVCTITIAANAVLLVGIGNTGGGAGRSISACVANGTALTQLGRFENNAGGVVATLFGLTAPASGVISISAAVVGAAMNIQMYAVTFLNAKATTPFGTVVGNTAGAVNNINLSLSTSTSDMVAFFGFGINTLTCMNATVRQVDSSIFGATLATTAGPAAAISISCSALITVQNLAFFGVNVAFSAAAAGGNVFGYMALTGVGH